MNTVLRRHGMSFMIFVDDHEPAHVHVIGDRRMRIDVSGQDGRPRVAWNDGVKAGDVRKALQAVADNQEFLLEAWRRIHGR